MKKYVLLHTLLWSYIIVFASMQLYLGHIKDVANFLIQLLILSSCLSVLLEIKHLKLGWLMGLGWGLYGSSLIIDILCKHYLADTWAVQFDIVADILKFGVVLIGIALYKAIKEKKWLINNLRLEVKYRRDLEVKLNKIACIDELTQIGNRRAFFKFYDELVKQYQQPQLIFIDLDNFKQLNDTYGHQKGDELLKQFSTCLAAQCADKGLAYRFGGDEFVILYDGIGQQLMASIKQKMHEPFKKTKLSISYGCINIDKKEGADAQILKVDGLMYENKKRRKSSRKRARSLRDE